MVQTAILGVGSIALGMAALLAESGHSVTVWSPSGRLAPDAGGSITLAASGAVIGTFNVTVATSPADAVTGAETIILAVPGNGHRAVMDAVAPYLSAGQTFVVSSHCSFSALYLSRLLGARDLDLPIVALGTTVVSGRRTGPASVTINNIRQRLDAAALPTSRADEGLAACRALFGDRFEPRADLLAISLSNLNPQNHMAMALCNMTRIETGEIWGNYAGITGTVGRLIESLDLERLALASAFGLNVRSVQDHFHLSFAAARGSIAEMAAEIHARGNAPNGPTSLDTRYVHEDVPFGLVPTEMIGRIAGIATPLHTAGIDLFSALYGIDFRAANDLLPALRISELSVTDLANLCRSGFAVSAAAA